MSKLIGLLNSPWLGVLLPVVAFLLGVGNVPFSDVDSFTKFLSSHFPQIGGLTIVAAGAWALLRGLKDYIDRGTISKALANGKVDLGDVVGAVKDNDRNSGTDAATYVKSALADGAFITLFHACDFDAELTAKLNDAHALYRVKRVEA